MSGGADTGVATSRLGILAHRDFRWLLIARMASMIGSSLAPVALAFAVLDVDRSPGALGLVLGGRTAMLTVFVVVGGVVADRLPRTLVLQLAHGASMLTQGSAAWLLLSGHATIASLLVVECLNGIVTAFTLPALQGLIPQVVPRTHLQQANALLALVRNGANIGGPLVAGLLVAGPGSGWALAADAASYGLAVLALTRVRLPRVAAPGSVAEDGSPDLVAGDADGTATASGGGLREGWREVRSRTWLWVIVVVFAGLNAIQAGGWGVLGPYVAKTDERLGIHGWAGVVSAFAVGSVVMTLVLLRWRLRAPLLLGMAGTTLLGVSIFTLGAWPLVWVMVPLALAAGLGSEVFNAGWDLAVMENVPQSALSRVYSFDMLGSFIAIPVGTMLFGALASVVPVSVLLQVGGALYVGGALAAIAVPSVRQLRRVA